jgi:SAM-dependent methyltransferase
VIGPAGSSGREAGPVCRICGLASGETVQLQEMMFGSDAPFDYFRCDRCGCLQIGVVPTDLSPFYPDSYYSFTKSTASTPLQGKVMKLAAEWAVGHRSIRGRMVLTLMPNLSIAAVKRVGLPLESRVLDVGSGDGKLLGYLASAGMRGLLGIDPYMSGDSNPFPGVTLKKTSLEDLPLRPPWDLIMFNHVFEHVPDPEETLSEVAARLAPGGRCLIRIPLLDSWAARHYGPRWIQLDPPRHLYLHTRQSLEVLADRVGLEIVESFHDSTGLQFWGSRDAIRHRALAGGGAKSVWRRAYEIGYGLPAQLLNWWGVGDQGGFILRRRNSAVS